MRHNLRGRKLNVTSSHRKAMLQNLTNALLKHEQIKTTLPKAKDLRSVVEKIITISKTDTIANRRLVMSRIQDAEMVIKLFTVLGPRYKDRMGGYTRVLKAGFRYGDAAPMAVIELMDRDETARGKDSGPVEIKDGEEAVEEVKATKAVKTTTAASIKEDAKAFHSKVEGKASKAKTTPIRKTQGK